MKCLDFVPHAQQRLLLRLILFPLLFVNILILKKLGKIYELYINLQFCIQRTRTLNFFTMPGCNFCIDSRIQCERTHGHFPLATDNLYHTHDCIQHRYSKKEVVPIFNALFCFFYISHLRILAAIAHYLITSLLFSSDSISVLITLILSGPYSAGMFPSVA